MNRTSRSSSEVRIAARSPARSMAGPGRVADVDAELARDDRRERRLAEAGRAVQQDVVGRLSPALRGLQQHRQVGLDLLLADVLGERARAEGALDDEVRLVLEIAGQDAGNVVDHRRAMVAQRRPISHGCSATRSEFPPRD